MGQKRDFSACTPFLRVPVPVLSITSYILYKGHEVRKFEGQLYFSGWLDPILFS
jgi:hypothetical protein